MMMGCRWSATRGMLMLLGLAMMVVLVAATRAPQPPSLEPQTKAYRVELLRDSNAPADGRQLPAAEDFTPRNWAPVGFRWLAQPEDVTDELSKLLDDFHDAASKADYDRYFKHWSPASVFLGTDATERWVGMEFMQYAKKRFDTGKGWTYHPHDRHIQVAPGGEAGFFDELLENEKYGTCRGSGVIRRMEGQWWLMQYNLSIPVPNDLAERVVGLIKAGAPKEPKGEEKHRE